MGSSQGAGTLTAESGAEQMMVPRETCADAISVARVSEDGSG